MAFGITTTGFSAKSLQDIKAELEAAFQESFGASIDVSPQSNFGQIIGVMAERYADLWAQGQAIYSAATPDGAIGASLDNVAGITGTVREAASSSTVTLTATGTPATVLNTGRVVSVLTVGTRFVTTAPGTIAAVAAWAISTAYVVGDRRRNGGTQRVYECTTAGTSAGSGGPTTTASAITDGSVVWRYLGDGTGAIDIEAESEDTGPKVAVSGTLTVIETPVSGWSSVINTLDADLGADEETDAALRIRREQELRGNGRASVESIRSAVLGVEGVDAATVFENITDATDGDGLPPHSVEVLVQGGDDAALREALWENVAAGIATYGSTSGTHTDSQGIAHTVKFSRPSQINIWVIMNLTVDATLWPADGADQVKAAIVAYGDAQKAGKNAVSVALSAQAFALDIGVLDSTALIGLTNPPSLTTTIAIALREIAMYDTSRITVNATPGTP